MNMSSLYKFEPIPEFLGYIVFSPKESKILLQTYELKDVIEFIHSAEFQSVNRISYLCHQSSYYMIDCDPDGDRIPTMLTFMIMHKSGPIIPEIDRRIDKGSTQDKVSSDGLPF